MTLLIALAAVIARDRRRAGRGRSGGDVAAGASGSFSRSGADITRRIR